MKTIAVLNPFNAAVYYEETVGSTMIESRALAAKGAPSGTVVVAGSQENGRGRQGRAWTNNRPKESLLFTVYREYPGLEKIPRALTLKTGLAVAEAIVNLFSDIGENVYVKWPNDIMLVPSAPNRSAKKAVGILVETDGSKTFTGIGVNLFQPNFSEPLNAKAVSILAFLRDSFPGRAALAADVYERLLALILARLAVWIPPGPEPADWHAKLTARLYKRGEPVTFAEGPPDTPRLIHGVLCGIAPDGALLLTPEGATEPTAFSSGELRVY